MFKIEQEVWWASHKGILLGTVRQVNQDGTYQVSFEVKQHDWTIETVKQSNLFAKKDFREAYSRFVQNNVAWG